MKKESDQPFNPNSGGVVSVRVDSRGNGGQHTDAVKVQTLRHDDRDQKEGRGGPSDHLDQIGILQKGQNRHSDFKIQILNARPRFFGTCGLHQTN